MLDRLTIEAAVDDGGRFAAYEVATAELHQNNVTDVRQYLTGKMGFTEEPGDGAAVIFKLAGCPFKGVAIHDDNPFIIVDPQNGIIAGCHADKCDGKDWAAMQEAFGEPFRPVAKSKPKKTKVANPLTADPHRLAEAHRDKWAHNGKPTTLNIGEDLLVWRDGLWTPTSDKAMLPYLTATVKDEFDSRPYKGRPMPVKRSVVGDTLAALKSMSRLDRDEIPPFWLGEHDWAACDCVPFRNGILHVPSWLVGRDCFLSPTPEFFNRHRLAFDFDPHAPTPERWLQFLAELWEDSACHDLLHEWAGYACLTLDTSHQKLLMMIGKPRAGKGVILSILGEMVGGNFAAQSLKHLVGEFGLAPLLGKQLLLCPDTKTSRKVLDESCAILKAISGEDAVTVNVKNRQQVTAKLATRIIIPSNDLLAIPDGSEALQARQLFLYFDKSFFGREDTTLKMKLRAELPGICLLFLDGLRRLRERGKFSEPEASREVRRRVNRAANPVQSFVAERCTLAPAARIGTEDLYASFVEWLGDEPDIDVRSFGRALSEMNITRTRLRVEGERHYFYTGIKLQ